MPSAMWWLPVIATSSVRRVSWRVIVIPVLACSGIGERYSERLRSIEVPEWRECSLLNTTEWIGLSRCNSARSKSSGRTVAYAPDSTKDGFRPFSFPRKRRRHQGSATLQLNPVRGHGFVARFARLEAYHGRSGPFQNDRRQPDSGPGHRGHDPRAAA